MALTLWEMNLRQDTKFKGVDLLQIMIAAALYQIMKIY
jgi:hypothetical protein